MIGVQAFRKKPITINAIQLTWENWNAVCEFVPKPWFVRGVWLDKDGNVLPDGETNMQPSDNTNLGLLMQTQNTQQFLVRGNDWIIKGVADEFYPCHPDVFKQTYDLADDAPVHPFEVRLSIGANDWNFALQAVRETLERFETLDADHVGICSGGWHGAFSIDVFKRDVSPDQYRDELEQWRERQVVPK